MDRRRPSIVGEWVRRHRKEHPGLTQAVLGQLVGRERKFVLEIEAGRREPNYSELLALAEVLGADLGELLKPATQGKPTAGKLAVEESTTNRRKFIAGMVAFAAVGPLDLEHLAVDGTDLDGLEAMAHGLATQVYICPPAALLPPAEAQLVALRALMPGPRRLASVMSTAAMLTGHVYSKLQRRGDAYAAYSLAWALAQDAGDAIMQALAVSSKSALYSTVARGPRQGDTATALALLDEGVRLGGRGPRLLRVATLSRRAEERAVAGDATGAIRDLEDASSALAEGGDDERTFFGARNAAELSALKGSVELLIGDNKAALGTLDVALAGLNSRQIGWRAAILADQGAALARSGELDAAVDRLERALQLARTAGDHVIRVRGVRQRDLARWADEPAVRRLDERLTIA